MAYHDNEYKPDSPKKITEKKEELIAPPGFHYMPDGTLMSNAEHEKLYEVEKVKVSSKRELFLENRKQINDYLPQQITQQYPQQLSSKRRSFLSMTKGLDDYIELNVLLESFYTKDYKRKKRVIDPATIQLCKNDVVIVVDVSATMDYHRDHPEINTWAGMLGGQFVNYVPLQLHAGVLGYWDPCHDTDASLVGSYPSGGWSHLAQAHPPHQTFASTNPNRIGHWTQAINDMVSSIIAGLTPQMNAGDLQIGICTFADTIGFNSDPNTANNPNYIDHTRMLPTASGKWLSNDPVELNTVAQGIFGIGGTNVHDALNISHEMLDKAITDFPNCSLGNRNARADFKRTTIIISDNYEYDSSEVAHAEDNWQTEDVIFVHVNDGGPGPNRCVFSEPIGTTNYMKTKLQPMCGGTFTQTGGSPHLAFSGGRDDFPSIANDIVSLFSGACVTWDCTGPPNYDCIDRYDGLGQYFDGPGSSGGIGTWSGLNWCNNDCGPSTWRCGEFFHPNDPNFPFGATGVCTEVTFAATNVWGFPAGPYSSLSQCQPICDSGIVPASWDCVNGTCVDPGTGVGQYSTFHDCNANCVDPSWMCTSVGCVEMYTDPPQPYSSLNACQSACTLSTWNCTPNGCVDPGDGSGQYTNIHVCQSECVHYECIPTSPSTSACVTKTGVPSGFSWPYPVNLYPTLVMCMGYCGGPLIYSGPISPLPIDTETSTFDETTDTETPPPREPEETPPPRELGDTGY